ncbi:magnesium-transporting ATPase (P-type) [Cytobacillus eiseniae]|uniref:Magnesium-transporting ATPase (P-type) n=1 Tax=Cytobacillus eiseniae TaxID=762947 RepID=A0ABS4RHS0_9BACI|nr:magnesium-transporting ATPase (P-type) [Cytobacillus eiseniae]
MLNGVKQLSRWKSIWIIGLLTVVCNFSYASINIYKYYLYKEVISLNSETYSLLKNLTNYQDVTLSIILVLFILSTWIVIRKQDDSLLLSHALLYTILMISLLICNFIITKLFSASFNETFWAINNFIIINAVVLIYSLIKTSLKQCKLNKNNF